jgi:hypothetical protein
LARNADRISQFEQDEGSVVLSLFPFAAIR